jgi:hyperosmotically inducible periplasmic protein
MIRALLKVVLLVVILAVAAAFFLGYRIADGGDDIDVVAAEPAVAPSIDTQRARETGAKVGETVATGAAQAQDALNDGAVTAKIKSKMALDDTVKALSIDVDTDNGVVTLSGSVTSQAEKAKAVQLAKDTDGVSSVVDRLVVR